MARRLTLIAGSGALVPLVCTTAQTLGMDVQVIDMVGRADLDARTVLHLPVTQARAIADAVYDFRSTDLVIAGGVALSDRDREALASIFGIAGWMARSLGDVGLAMALFAHFRLKGVRVVGAHQIVRDLLAPEGHIAGPTADAPLIAQARRALTVARAVGRVDLGQAVVMSGGRPVAAEDAGGTDALLDRVASLRQVRQVGDGAAPLILAKAKKPRQPKFVDLPAIGPETVSKAAAAGVTLVVVEAHRSLVLEREALSARAASLGVSVIGLKASRG